MKVLSEVAGRIRSDPPPPIVGKGLKAKFCSSALSLDAAPVRWLDRGKRQSTHSTSPWQEFLHGGCLAHSCYLHPAAFLGGCSTCGASDGRLLRLACLRATCMLDDCNT